MAEGFKPILARLVDELILAGVLDRGIGGEDVGVLSQRLVLGVLPAIGGDVVAAHVRGLLLERGVVVLVPVVLEPFRLAELLVTEGGLVGDDRLLRAGHDVVRIRRGGHVCALGGRLIGRSRRGDRDGLLCGVVVPLRRLKGHSIVVLGGPLGIARRALLDPLVVRHACFPYPWAFFQVILASSGEGTGGDTPSAWRVTALVAPSTG